MKIETSEVMKVLRMVIENTPRSNAGLPEFFMKSILPHLDFNSWVSHVTDSIPEGKVTTFGSVAGALGSPQAARAVGSWAAENKESSFRLVYSDGRVPPDSIGETNPDLDALKKGDDYYVSSDSIIRDLEMDLPPFQSLEIFQKETMRFLKEPAGNYDKMAGVDISSRGDDNVCAVCSMDLDGNPTGSTGVKGDTGIPYVSGFLFFREAPLVIPSLMKAMDKGLVDDGTLIVMDGNGYLHPRRMGIASHIGSVTDLMTCGVSKKLLTGRRGDWVTHSNNEQLAGIWDGDELIGYASRCGEGSPVFFSNGNRTRLKDITETLIRVKRGRLPEPIRSAHNTANKWRRSETPPCDLEIFPLSLHEGIDR
jgi:deoxyribonuclease V